VPASPRRITVVGAGSAYLPGVIRGLLHRAGLLAGSELVLHDLDAARLRLMETLAGRMIAAAGAGLAVRAELDLRAALDGAGFVFTTFRPGGMPARHLDESIPLRHGVVGQETAGPGGFLLACRSVPVLLRIAALCAEVAPRAWIVNYTNPTNIVTDAVLRFGERAGAPGARIVGLCDQHVGDLERWAGLLGFPPGWELEADWIGLNHATWAERVRLVGGSAGGGTDLSAEVRRRLAALEPPAGADAATRQLAELGRALGFLPNSYARYYFFHDDAVAELRAKGTTRAQELIARLPALYADYAEAAAQDAPDPSRERGGGEHGEFAVDVICAIAAGEGRRLIVNTRNRGAIEGLPAEAVVEVPARVDARGPAPLAMGPLPHPVRGLVAAIHEYEWLAAEAAATGDRRLALQALMVHPFIRRKGTAEAILAEGLAAHRDHLPQFV
jgi:6-phospho-beta-glucosidase